MTLPRLDQELIRELRKASGADQIEVYLKRGRSRRFVRSGGLEYASEAAEQGWAVRGTTERGSFFYCGTGDPDPAIQWPEPDGYPVLLPEPAEVPQWHPAAEIEAPLVSESEIRSLIGAIEKQLARTLPSARLDHLTLEDGQSQNWIGNSLGLLETWRGRAASIVVEASAAPDRGARIRLELVRREVREFSPRRLAERIVDLLTVRHDGRPVTRDRCEVVVAPHVASRLLAGLTPLFEAGASERLVERVGGASRFASTALSVVDDGRLEGGVLAAPVDGEGTATREAILIENGAFCQPLLGWWQSRRGGTAGGCSRRFSWRDQPSVGPSHLYVRPDDSVRAADMVATLSRGYYLLDCAPQGRFDFDEDRFSLEVRGFEMLGGRARGPVSGVQLVGRISALLSGVRAVGRDLSFQPTGRGLIGSPTIRLGGLEIRESR